MLWWYTPGYYEVIENNLLELITKIKEIPSSFSHSDILKNELEEIKKYKEDTFWI